MWAERGGLDFEGRARWDAWTAIKGLDAAKAKLRFVKVGHAREDEGSLMLPCSTFPKSSLCWIVALLRIQRHSPLQRHSWSGGVSRDASLIRECLTKRWLYIISQRTEG